ncbi:MAG: hypothetical protein SNJ55_10660 [Chloroherpetonaceae bacterium]
MSIYQRPILTFDTLGTKIIDYKKSNPDRTQVKILFDKINPRQKNFDEIDAKNRLEKNGDHVLNRRAS